MKKLKIFFASLFTISTPFSLTSCVGPTDNRQLNDKHFEFINDIEFSVGAKLSGGYITLGTAWVYKVLSDTDYTYQLITNYHVYYSMKQANSFCYAFNSYDERSRNISISEIYNQEIINQNQTMLNPFFIETKIGTPKVGYMDICSIELNFSATVNGDSKLKQKLNKINEIAKQSENNNVLKINKTKTGHNNDTIYMAGYPWSTSDKERNYTYFTEWYDRVSFFEANALNQFSDSTYDTYQDQYWLPPQNSFPMGGGASGSLVINNNYEAIGIYWGGGANSFQFYPSFALFYMGSSDTAQTGKYYATDFFYSLANR